MSNTTILTPTLFTTYCDNYFLGTSAPKNILNGHITQQLPTIIKNVETSLNSMLNGRLYNKYNPANLTFNGNNILSPTVEQETLYSLLTEAVLYKIQTGTYVNVQNNFGGNVNGSNNFNTSNSNVVGLRNDIRDKLVLLGLYKNANFANATTPNVYAAASPGVNQGPLTMQQVGQLNTYLSTNNFTLGGKWDFANLLINGTPINTYIDNQVNVEAPNYNSVLINYLPNTPIPLIATNDITNWNNAANNILKDYLPNGTVPYISSTEITQWNNLLPTQNVLVNILYNYGAGTDTTQVVPLITTADVSQWNNSATLTAGALKNYSQNTELPFISSEDVQSWNGAISALQNIEIILQNYWPQTVVPTITQADITKWNSNSGGGGSGTTITKKTYTITVTNNWSIDYNNNGLMTLTSTSALSSPDMSADGLSFTWTSQSTLPSSVANMNFNLTSTTKTILSTFLYPGINNTSNQWTNMGILNLPSDWQNNSSLYVDNSTQQITYGMWNIYGSDISPTYIPNNSLVFSFNYDIYYSGSGTAPSSPTQTFTEVAVFMFDVLIAG